MIKFLRNPEVRSILLIYIAISAAAIVFAFSLGSEAGLLTACICAVFILIYLVSTYRRYKRISELASDVNRILHGNNDISLENYSEGELAVLHSEIYKMTVRLREQQQKLTEDKIYLADSIADISHQIRTPLTSINLLVEFLSDSAITEKKRQNLTKELYDLLARIDWLITTLLKISKLDAGTVQFKEEIVSLKELIEKASSTLLIPIELHGQELSVIAEGNFCGDISWTCEALGNIIKNCMEHTPEKGKIEIIASENPLYSEIIIKDNGCGIDKEDLPYIFKRFYKGKNSDDKSFGVGLALSRTIITSQNGTVKAENRMPKGAVFTVRFYKKTM